MSNLHHQSGASGASAAGLAPNRRLPPRVEARNSGCAWQVHLLNSIDTKTRTTQKRFGVSRDVAAAKNTLPNGIYSALPLSNTFIWGYTVLTEKEFASGLQRSTGFGKCRIRIRYGAKRKGNKNRVDGGVF
jgi:hypothetical protein